MIDLEAGYELDERIATEVLGWTKRNERIWHRPGDRRPVALRAFSSDIAAAWLVVERMEDLAWMAHLTRVIGGWECRFTPLPHTERYVYEEEDTAPLAICKAALAAVKGAQP